MPGTEHFTVSCLDSGCAPVFDQNAMRLGKGPDHAAGLAGGAVERTGKRSGSAARHLRFRWLSKECCYVMTKAPNADVNLAQPVEEQQAGLNGGVLEFLL